MSTLVECVPNFSEGRDKSKVDAIVEAMKLDGVYLLDCEMDPDHNRCVITGRPKAYYRKLKMSRIALRDFGNKGLIPGLVKSSW